MSEKPNEMRKKPKEMSKKPNEMRKKPNEISKKPNELNKKPNEMGEKEKIKQTEKQIAVDVAKPTRSLVAERAMSTQEIVKEKINTRKIDKSLPEKIGGSIKGGDSEDSKHKVEKNQEDLIQEELLPEIKTGTMEIADSEDPKYKTLYIFMDKHFDIFGPDKRKPGQPEIGTMKKISEDEFAANIKEIKARYEAIEKKEEENEINWNILLQAKNVEKDGSMLIFTIPTEIVPEVKKKKRKKR
ncbi:unnamed protein product [Onchocerca ochengi]|uniref:Uncharacterized protein n=1 Tax=Onchocerca ochengi TaxID=42157 RepID=A0A182EGS9_ONCOC|nr:unnamed protein product [Onchocerca ochengi]